MVKRLAPFFSAYKYYKLGRISIKLIPASTLPIDPTGLSYEEGENTVDPRDQLTPGLTRITNGEDVWEDFSSLSPEEQRKMYYTMMLDTRWYKWSLQSGLKRSAVPLYWQVGQYHQDKYPGATMNFPGYNSTALGSNPTIFNQKFYGATTSAKGTGNQPKFYFENGQSDPRGFFQVGHRGRIGWLPTDGLNPHPENSAGPLEAYVATPGCVECFKILLPPAIKTRYYYRCFVTESVFFKDPVTNLVNEYGYRGIDRFIYPTSLIAAPPGEKMQNTVLNSPNYGVNDGSGDPN